MSYFELLMAKYLISVSFFIATHISDFLKISGCPDRLILYSHSFRYLLIYDPLVYPSAGSSIHPSFISLRGEILFQPNYTLTPFM